MRLLRVSEDDELSFADFPDTSLLEYAILSHTWGQELDEVTFEDLTNGSNLGKEGYRKIRFCASQARKDNIQYIWVDSCCIDRKSSAELSEAINSMFRWYEKADKCYVYLSDVTFDHVNVEMMQQRFAQSRWFTRGWTLQELIAPKSVDFFSRDGFYLGSKASLEERISDITGIPKEVLRGDSIVNYSLAVRQTWMAKRTTTRPEDGAYCLLGIFDVTMPLVYGEGHTKAMRRLEREVKDSIGPSSTTTLDSDQRRRLLESLSFDDIDARQTTIAPAHIRTCQWLLSCGTYAEWQDDTKIPEHHGLIWIKGKPGSGKSTLMKYALLNFRTAVTTAIVVSFFFSARGKGLLEKSTIGMYRALIVQILERRPELLKIFDKLSSFTYRRILKDQEWDIESLKMLLEAAIRNLGQTPLVCFIDALDEVAEWQIRDMITFFELLGEVAISCDTMFRVCFSSRYYPHVTIRHGVELRMDAEMGHYQDIAEYISSELKIGKAPAAQQIRKEMESKASGIFMWAVLVTGILNKDYDRGRAWDLQRRLNELPGDLHELFRDMFTRDLRDRSDLVLCIQWVLYSRCALSPEELCAGIHAAVGSQDRPRWAFGHVSKDVIERFIIDSSKGLVEITKVEHPTVQFIHESVKEFLAKDEGMRALLGAEGSSGLMGKSHDELKICCLNEIRTKSLDTDFPSPFRTYAEASLFYHANLASRHGICQSEFLTDFAPDGWVTEGSITVSLLYSLAKSNCESLIRDYAGRLACFRPEPSPFGIPIFAALGHGCRAATIALVQAHAEIMLEDDPLKESCRRYCKDTTLKQVFELSKPSPSHATIILWLSEYGDELLLALALRVLKSTVDVVGQQNGFTPLLLAIVNENETMVKTILETANVSVNYRDGRLGRSPLTWAIMGGNKTIVNLLLGNAKTDINLTDTKHGRSPLHWARGYGRADIIAALLEAKAQGHPC